MPSLQAHFLNRFIRLSVKRRSWGKDEKAIVKRMRGLVSTPPVFEYFWTHGLNIRNVNEDGICGEWISPDVSGSRAVILYIHGGGFVACSPATHRPMTATLARNTGCKVFSLDYGLAPEHPFPAGLNDAVAAYKWLLRQIPSGTKIALAGDSSGGNLALSLLLRIRDEALPAPACAVCFSPWVDLTCEAQSDVLDENSCVMFYRENGIEFAGIYLAGASPRDPYASPFFADLSGLPPRPVSGELN